MLEMSRIDRPSLGSLFHVLFPPRKIRGQEEIVPIFADLHASKNNFARQIILSFSLSLPPSKCLLDFQLRGKIKKKKNTDIGRGGGKYSKKKILETRSKSSTFRNPIHRRSWPGFSSLLRACYPWFMGSRCAMLQRRRRS